MALIAPLFAFLGRFVGKFLNMAFGWASVMLFGRVPQSKQLLLAGVSLGSVAWVIALLGIALPEVGAFLIAAVPAPDWIDEDWIRLAMLVLAITLPLLVGLGGLFLLDKSDRPGGIGLVVQVLRGYPYAAVLAVVLLFLIVVAPINKVRSLVKRWKDAHVPVVVKPGGYERVAADLERALDGAGLGIDRSKAPVVLELPSKLLAAVGGESVRRLVPDHLILLKSGELQVTIHPSDVAIAGTSGAVARARAAIASRLGATEAYLTTTEEAQEVEDALGRLREDADGIEALGAVDERLAVIDVPYEEWEVLYRQRLQVERDLLNAGRIEPAEPRRSPLDGLAAAVRSVLPR